MKRFYRIQYDIAGIRCKIIVTVEYHTIITRRLTDRCVTGRICASVLIKKHGLHMWFAISESPDQLCGIVF